jgi:hypothetical protein
MEAKHEPRISELSSWKAKNISYKMEILLSLGLMCKISLQYYIRRLSIWVAF